MFRYDPAPVPQTYEDMQRYLESEFRKIREAMQDLDPWGRWDDLHFPADTIPLFGASTDPDRDDDGTFLFDAGTTETVIGIAQLPHDWALEPWARTHMPVRPHIHTENVSTNSGDVLWRFEYDIANVNGTFAGSYTSNDTVQSFSSPTVGDHRAHGLFASPGLDMSSYKYSCIMKWKLSRIGGDASDTLSGDVKLLELDIHVPKGHHGTYYEYSDKD